MEEMYGFEESKINENTGKKVNFFNLGPKNNWRGLLKDEFREKIETKCKDEMEELGYL